MPHQPRHHHTADSAGTVGQLARAVAALIVLLVIVAGVPALMAQLQMVPHALPSWGQVTQAMTRRDTGQLVVIVLAAGIWVSWALFTLSLLGEIAAAARRRPARLLPGLAVFQRPAAALVAAIVIGLTVTPTIGGVTVALAGGPPTATHTTTASPLPLAASAPFQHSPARPAPAAGPTYRVQQRDTLWGIAERTLGDGLRYPEIVALNPAQIGPDNEITAGTALTLPVGAGIPTTPAAAEPVAHRDPVTVTVRNGDTLSDITQNVTGDPHLYPEVAAANNIADPDVITPGQVITIPADLLPPPNTATATGGPTVTVRPGDTLSGITQRATGDGDQWPQIWRANADRPEPAGAHLTNPDEIYAGWTITIPATLHGPARQAHPPATPHPAAHTANRPATNGHHTTTASAHPPTTGHQPAISPTGHAPASGPGRAPNGPSDTNVHAVRPAERTAIGSATGSDIPATSHSAPAAAAPPAPSPATPHPTIAAPRSTATVTQPAQHPASPDRRSTIAFATGGGLLLAGVSLAALLAYRQTQFHRRRPGRRIATGTTDTARMERAVLGVGNSAQTDVTLLDHALRGLAQLAADGDWSMPEVTAACLTPGGLTLVLAEPDDSPPAPWQPEEAGTRWTITSDTAVNYRDERREYSLAPYPTLVSVGYTDTGDQWLLDLERIGTVSLDGDAERVLNLARFIAAELAHNTWSEMLTVTMAGFGAELVPANPDRLVYTDDVTAAIAAAEAWLDPSPTTTVLRGRAGPAGERWAPQVLLIDPAEHADATADIAHLQESIRAQRGRSCVAVVTTSPTPVDDDHGWHLSIDEHGLLSIPPLGLRLRAQQIPADEAAQLAQMLTLAADADDTPCPAAPREHPWDDDTDMYGALTLSAGDRPASPRTGLHLADTDRRDSLLPLPDATYLDSTAVAAAELGALAPMVNDQIRARVENSDPDLDADLADWDDPDCPRPRIAVLGPPTVKATGNLPQRSPQVRANTEAVVYLATRGPAGVSSTVFAETMWPNDPDVAGKSKVKNMMWAIRTWLGQDPNTRQYYVPDGRGESGIAPYRIEGALLDADLFRRLRKRGMARGTAGIVDLALALQLVGGPPFAGITERRKKDDSGPGGWLWMTLANTRLDLDYTAMIVDTVHTVATHHLAVGEPTEAADAVRIGLTAGSYDDILLLDLLIACQKQGLTAEAAACEAQLRANYEGADLPPRTAEILHRILRAAPDPRQERVS